MKRIVSFIGAVCGLLWAVAVFAQTQTIGVDHGVYNPGYVQPTNTNTPTQTPTSTPTDTPTPTPT